MVGAALLQQDRAADRGFGIDLRRKQRRQLLPRGPGAHSADQDAGLLTNYCSPGGAAGPKRLSGSARLIMSCTGFCAASAGFDRLVELDAAGAEETVAVVVERLCGCLVVVTVWDTGPSGGRTMRFIRPTVGGSLEGAAAAPTSEIAMNTVALIATAKPNAPVRMRTSSSPRTPP